MEESVDLRLSPSPVFQPEGFFELVGFIVSQALPRAVLSLIVLSPCCYQGGPHKQKDHAKMMSLSLSQDGTLLPVREKENEDGNMNRTRTAQFVPERRARMDTIDE